MAILQNRCTYSVSFDEMSIPIITEATYINKKKMKQNFGWHNIQKKKCLKVYNSVRIKYAFYIPSRINMIFYLNRAIWKMFKEKKKSCKRFMCLLETITHQCAANFFFFISTQFKLLNNIWIIFKIFKASIVCNQNCLFHNYKNPNDRPASVSCVFFFLNY